MSHSPKFIYFDLGNVLLFFDHHRACRQLAQLSGAAEQAIWDALFASGLELEYERGKVTSRQMHETFQDATKTRLEFPAFAQAFSDVFEVNLPMKAILAQLKFCGHRLGLLSNTNEMHWQLFTDGRYALLPEAFQVRVLSHELGAVKPDVAIFRAAIEKAGVAPHEIFYMDDMPGHVAGARAIGIDAVQFQDAPTLLADLRQRGIDLNY
jgi:glucose-1-phosphatase